MIKVTLPKLVGYGKNKREAIRNLVRSMHERANYIEAGNSLSHLLYTPIIIRKDKKV